MPLSTPCLVGWYGHVGVQLTEIGWLGLTIGEVITPQPLVAPFCRVLHWVSRAVFVSWRYEMIVVVSNRDERGKVADAGFVVVQQAERRLLQLHTLNADGVVLRRS